MTTRVTQEEYERRRMEVATYIVTHPEDFDMDTWGYRTHCGTVACLAGTATLFAEQKELCSTRWTRGSNVLRDVVVLPNGRAQTLDLFARDYLGLDHRDIFYDFQLTAELAAKRLLEEPYIS